MTEKKKTNPVNDIKIDQYEKQLDDLVRSYNKESTTSNKSIEKQEQTFFDLGKKLHEIRKELEEKDSSNTKSAAKKKFVSIKKNITKKIKKDIASVNRVVKVAGFCESEIYARYKDSLPSGWGALYLVCGLKSDKIELLMDGTIDSAITRDALAKKVEIVKNIDKKKPYPRIIIQLKNNQKPTVEFIAALQNFLNNHENKSWQATIKDIVDKQKNNTSQAS